MILNREIFDIKIQSMIDIYIGEHNKKRKSHLVIVSLKCIFDSLITHKFLLESDDLQEMKRKEVKINL